jgi:hypothetical protein
MEDRDLNYCYACRFHCILAKIVSDIYANKIHTDYKAVISTFHDVTPYSLVDSHWRR